MSEVAFRYQRWCMDCLGEDFQGCFDGGIELSEDAYATYQEAEIAGNEAASGCGLWAFKVVEEGGE